MSELNLRQTAERLVYWCNRIERASTEAEEAECCDERDKLLAVFRKADAERASPTPPTTDGQVREALETLVKAWDAYQEKASSPHSEGQADAYYMLAKYLWADWEKAKAALLSSPAAGGETVGRDHLEWALDEIDVLSNMLVQFAYPQGVAMIGRDEDQAERYVAARQHARAIRALSPPVKDTTK